MEKAKYRYIDSPFDTFYLCDEGMEKLYMSCTISKVFGILSGYIFPVFGLFGVVSNIYICYIFLVRYPKRTRQLILLSFLAVADINNIIVFGWLWIFPAKGLPYMTGGKYYFFILNQSDFFCTFFRTLQFYTSTVTFAIFLLVCIDRCFAIYFPLKSLQVTDKMTIIGCFVTFVTCLPISLLYTGFVKSVENESKVYCTVSSKDVYLNTFLKFYRILVVHSGVLFVISIIFCNVALIFKLFLLSRNKLSVRYINYIREIRSTITILILSILFLSGSLPNTILYLFLKSIQNRGDMINKLQFLYMLSDLGALFFLWLESTNVMIYMWRMKTFRKYMFTTRVQNFSMPSSMKTKIYNYIYR